MKTSSTYRGFSLECVDANWFLVAGYSRWWLASSLAGARLRIQHNVALGIAEALWTAGRMASQ